MNFAIVLLHDIIIPVIMVIFSVQYYAIFLLLCLWNMILYAFSFILGNNFKPKCLNPADCVNKDIWKTPGNHYLYRIANLVKRILNLVVSL